MIERTVLVKLREEFAEEAKRREIASYSREALIGVPGVQGVTVGVPADENAAAVWDLALRVQFEDLEAVTRYVVDPAHREYVDRYLRPRIEFIKAWNFESL